MKREEMILLIRDVLIDNQGSIYYADVDELKTIADSLLNDIEKAGMKPPCVSEEDCQALMSVYMAGYTFNQWDEDLAKDEKVQKSKKRWAEARADKRPLRERLAEHRNRNEKK